MAQGRSPFGRQATEGDNPPLAFVKLLEGGWSYSLTQREQGTAVFPLLPCPGSPWTQPNGAQFSKEDFSIDLRAKTITCPSGHTQAIVLGQTMQFDPQVCGACSLRTACTTAGPGSGRSVRILDDEPLQKRLRAMAKSKSGRERFRQRVAVEHSLAHIGQRQGSRSRYFGTRKNLFDLRRAALIQNLETTQRRAA